MARPPKYKTVEELQAAVDKYFSDCEGKPLVDADGSPVLNKWGEAVIVGAKPPTVTGLALALGFATRKSLIDYQAKKEFLHTITRAKSRCEEYAESRLFDKDGANGARFSLEQNFRWGKDGKGEENESGVRVIIDV